MGEQSDLRVRLFLRSNSDSPTDKPEFVILCIMA